MKITKQWNGPIFLERLNRAAGRSIVAIGVNVAVATKQVTHVETGTLRRSVFAASPTADHADDQRQALTADLLAEDFIAGKTFLGPAVEVGSWLDYACVEWVGRGHPGLQQGFEAIRGTRANAIVWQAFREEGLSGLGSK